MYRYDSRIVMTLDAGGSNFIFTAIQCCHEIVEPIRLDAVNDNIEGCLNRLVEGFRMVERALGKEKPVAISFAFPGPADYSNGIIGDLPNFPAFRGGGVAMGPFLSDTFGLPVFINNDGNLYTYGEAQFGALPSVNAALAAAGSSKRYKNLLGITLGTGFGGGVVIDGNLLTGDNGCGGDVWLMRNCKNPELIAEEGASKRAVTRVYKEYCEDGRNLTSADIFMIAEGHMDGDINAARQAFCELGHVAGDAIVHALDIVDGIVVVGGGVAGAAKYIVPAIVDEMNSKVGMLTGESFPCLQMKAFDLTSEIGMKEFLEDNSTIVTVPFSNRQVRYYCDRKVGVTTSSIGTSTAVSIGAYTFALAQLDKNRKD